jgi:hypothetical protein
MDEQEAAAGGGRLNAELQQLRQQRQQAVKQQDTATVNAIDARIRRLMDPYRQATAAATPEPPTDAALLQLQLLVAQSVKIVELQRRQTRYLATIRGWVVFFSILWIIGMVIIGVAVTGTSSL